MRARGFTLVEVLVALVIVAAGAAAVLSSLNSAAMSTIYLRDKTFAGWIASNRLTETRLQTSPPQNGTTEGEVDYAGQRWQWRQQIVQAQIPGLQRIDVSVRPAPQGTAARATTGTATAVADNAPVGDWTITLSAVVGRDLARPGILTFDWEPPPTPGPGGAGTNDGANAGTNANGSTTGGASGNGGSSSGTGGAAGGAGTTTRPPGGPRFGEGPRT